MGWIGEKIRISAARVVATAADVSPSRAVALHAVELRDLVAIGVSLDRIAAALALAGLSSRRTGKAISDRILGRMLRSAPAAPAVVPPPSISLAAPEASAPAEPAKAAAIPTSSRIGRGLEALAKKRPN